MSHLIRLSLAAALALATPALAGPQDITLACVRQDHDFTLKMGLGHYTAIHFIPKADQSAAAIAREYFSKAHSVAGVFHVFVSPGDQQTLKTWAQPFKDEDLMIAADPKGALAAEFKLTDRLAQGLPATIILSPDGTELFRHEGASPADFLTFPDFKRTLDQRWKANTSEYNLPKGKALALDGYDPVTYITSNTATKGRPELTSDYRGVTYQFSTPDTRRAFFEDPERYLPTYGGWCATALGKNGEKVEIDPTNFKVTNGRLFLFYKSLLADAKKDWNKHEKEWEPAADNAWKKFSGEDPIRPIKK